MAIRLALYGYEGEEGHYEDEDVSNELDNVHYRPSLNSTYVIFRDFEEEDTGYLDPDWSEPPPLEDIPDVNTDNLEDIWDFIRDRRFSGHDPAADPVLQQISLIQHY